ncbi:DUF4222 domain-containing protein [Serratia marcescens]|uniref:DUF4222 domain-containing protein n=1 Tax=Serratia TaxID=613 RepID=UPI00166090F9|nr:DUF4222 domain-containing protein [Serratia marcescens]ELH4241250.1 DUF4222 domain-containing protein [Serratia marcescens]MBN5232497.1 DUF4222 domain-containing protein [Serratia marcescens]MDU1286245.1 DUF4222 domain-containing protein [Serratia marcescens]MDU1396155.1 DUF4222 domain-containing protein [Serratia marcescens]HAT3782074.1 DUF4222 domain-containing protein [Serratia marcescens]
MSQYVPVDRTYLDDHGNPVKVILWDRVERQVIFMREGYPHECMQPLERFKEKFKRVDI